MASSFFQEITKAVHDLKTAATTGFTIDDQAGKDLQAAITRLKTVVRDALRSSSRLGQAPPLGTSPAADVYKPFIATVASDPAQGAIPVLEQMLNDLVDAYDTIGRSMVSYRRSEQGNTSGITGAGNSHLPS